MHEYLADGYSQTVPAGIFTGVMEGMKRILAAMVWRHSGADPGIFSACLIPLHFKTLSHPRASMTLNLLSLYAG